MKLRAGLVSLVLATCLAACAGVPAPAPADRVFTGAAVYTVNPAQPWAAAVAVRDGRIT
ncbi:MAG: hypothetical protein HKN58_05745, partial [Xanthomonadales bacterium]|nr:hypothetical protein [Xanthomonadales bacterium]